MKVKIDNVVLLEKGTRKILARKLRILEDDKGFIDPESGHPISDAFAIGLMLQRHCKISAAEASKAVQDFFGCIPIPRCLLRYPPRRSKRTRR